MKLHHAHRYALCAALVLTGCQRTQDSVTAATQEATQSISQTMDTAMTEARRELAKENFTLDGKGLSLPSAHITPAGELVVDGKTITTTPEQKAMLVQYRAQIAGIAEAGIEVGAQGAELAGKAVTQAVGAIFSGKSESMKQQIKQEAQGIAVAAQKICEQLPALLATQQKLAESLPAFKPYATMDQSDVDECRVDQDLSHEHGHEPSDRQVEQKIEADVEVSETKAVEPADRR